MSNGESSKRRKPNEKELHNFVLGCHTVAERHRTIRTGIVCGLIAFLAVITAWTIIRIHTHAFWLEVLGMFFGPTGIVSLLLAWYLRRVSKKVDRAMAQRAKQDNETPNPKEGGDKPEGEDKPDAGDQPEEGRAT